MPVRIDRPRAPTAMTMWAGLTNRTGPAPKVPRREGGALPGGILSPERRARSDRIVSSILKSKELPEWLMRRLRTTTLAQRRRRLRTTAMMMIATRKMLGHNLGREMLPRLHLLHPPGRNESSRKMTVATMMAAAAKPIRRKAN